MEKWSRLPEWVRWILCFPIIVIASLIINICATTLAYLGLERIWIPDRFAELLVPIVGMMIHLPIAFYLIQILVPRKPHYLVGVYCVFALFGLVSGIFMSYLDIVNDADSVWETLRDTAWAGIGLVMSTYFFIRIRRGEDVI
jgi:hypothetical protein